MKHSATFSAVENLQWSVVGRLRSSCHLSSKRKPTANALLSSVIYHLSSKRKPTANAVLSSVIYHLSSNMITIFMADDHNGIRDSMCRTPEESGEFQVVGSAANVRIHRQHSKKVYFVKLKVKSKIGLVIYAMKNGIVRF